MFHAQSVTFLGSVVSAEGISMDPDKVRAVIDWPVPDSRVALQRFLGFANFYRRFIRNFSQVAAPLTFLTSSKTRFAWSEAAQGAFDRLKGLFTSAPILITPDPEKQFIVEVDASDVGVGAILSQRSSLDDKIHPCAFYSHRLSPAERNYDVGNRELLAIRLALGEWRHWLREPVCHLLSGRIIKIWNTSAPPRELNARQARWALFFGRFEFSISFRPGSKNLKPDALSRQFGPSGGPSTNESILPQRCVVGAAIWGVEQAVRRALSHVTRPPRAPEGTLFVPEVVRSAVLHWGHSSKLVAHPEFGVRWPRFANGFGGPLENATFGALLLLVMSVPRLSLVTLHRQAFLDLSHSITSVVSHCVGFCDRSSAFGREYGHSHRCGPFFRRPLILSLSQDTVRP